MANQITDNRPLVSSADSVTGWVDLTGAAAGTLDTEIKVQGTGSIGNYMSNTTVGLLYDMGTAQNWASNTFYTWISCGIVGLLNTKAAGGFAIRFTGATASNWFEVRVGGSDSWPSLSTRNFVQFVVDIELARSTAITNGWTGGTVPATSAIQRVGYSGSAAAMPRMADNIWIDEIRRLPANTPGIIIEGRNGGSTDWTLNDIPTQLGVGKGTAKKVGAAVAINTPIQIGINDTTTHAFTDTNGILLWEDHEYLPDGFYNITAVGNIAGSTSVKFGIKNGSGSSATGSQGTVIAAKSTSARWNMDLTGANVNTAGIYGSTLKHGGAFTLNSSIVDCVTTNYIDCTSALVTGSNQLAVSVVNPNTADGTPFMTTNSISQIVKSSFEFKDGHGVKIVSGGVSAQSSDGNVFIGAYGGTPGNNSTPASGSTDAMIYNDTGSALTISPTNGSTSPSIRNGAGATTVVSSGVRAFSFDLTPAITGHEWRIYEVTAIGSLSGAAEVAGEESAASSSQTYNYSYTADQAIAVQIIKEGEYVERTAYFTLKDADQTVLIELTPETN